MLQRPQELQPWQSQQNHPHQPHDEEIMTENTFSVLLATIVLKLLLLLVVL